MLNNLRNNQTKVTKEPRLFDGGTICTGWKENILNTSCSIQVNVLQEHMPFHHKGWMVGFTLRHHLRPEKTFTRV